jgi:hypothetical protein
VQRFAKNAETNVEGIKPSIAVSVLRCVIAAPKNAGEWQVLLHKINAGDAPAFIVHECF